MKDCLTAQVLWTKSDMDYYHLETNCLTSRFTTQTDRVLLAEQI